MLECYTQVLYAGGAREDPHGQPLHDLLLEDFEHVMAQGRSSTELLQELLSRKVHRSACTEMYNDAQKCSDFAQEFRDVKLHLFPCLVKRLSDCETLPGLDECLLRLDFRMELDNFFWSLLPRSCAPVRLGGAMLQYGTQFLALLVSLSMEPMQAKLAHPSSGSAIAAPQERKRVRSPTGTRVFAADTSISLGWNSRVPD